MFRWRLPTVLINIGEVAKSGVAKRGVAKCRQWQNVSGEKWQWQNVEWRNVCHPSFLPVIEATSFYEKSTISNVGVRQPLKLCH